MSSAVFNLSNFSNATPVSATTTSSAVPGVVLGYRYAPEEAARLEVLLREVEDLSFLSPELLARAIETNCWYHVTPFRSALVRTLELPASARILEVGCGGGALTRYLGERGYQVVAVEPSGGLAECARLRCRDLANVEVIHGFLEDVVSDQRFDFVVCVDPFFAESEFLDPAIQLFALCQKALKATGTLIVSVGNSLHVPGGAHIEPSRQHVRGGVAPLEALKRSLEGAGFFHMERYVTFPNHAAPQLLVNAAQAQQERIHWLPILRELFCTSEQAEKDMESWWRGVILEGLEEQLAPGWLILAHTHAVHSVLWNGKACRYFVPGSSNVSTEGVEVCSLGVQQAGVIDGIIKAAKPRAHSVTDYKESLVAADDRIDDLLAKETALTYELEGTREEIVRTQERHEGEIVKEQEARRIREAELGLVLKQYHAVGAMCHDMREEGRKLKDMLEELRRRYVASEEWGFALTKRISEAEAELQQARSSRIFRLIEKVKGMFSKRTPSKLSETVRESLRPDERQVQTIL